MHSDDSAFAPIQTAFPCTLSAWVKLTEINSSHTNTGTTHAALAIWGFTNNNFIMIGVGGTNGAFASKGSAGAETARASSGAGFANDVWIHLCGVFTSSTSMAIYEDGTSVGSSSTSGTPTFSSNEGMVFIGAANTVAAPFAGLVAHCAMWNVALNASEIAALARGMSPVRIRPSGLKGYWPLISTVVPSTGVGNQHSIWQAGAAASLMLRAYETLPGVSGDNPWVAMPFANFGNKVRYKIATLLPLPIQTPAHIKTYYKAGNDAATQNATGYSSLADGIIAGISEVNMTFPQLTEALAVSDVAAGKKFDVSGDVFEPPALDVIDTGWAGQTIRIRVGANHLNQVNSGQINITLEFGPASNGSIADCFIGHAAAAGDLYDFEAAPTRVTFDTGSNTKAISGRMTVTSDNITFTYDATKPIIVSIAFTGTTIDLLGYGNA